MELTHEREGLKLSGDMIGTFMAWLKDCEEGGATAYIVDHFEGVIMPEKGAAAFWYDLVSNGQRDVTTRHGGCPVIKGSKWILNKWLFLFDNFKKFPCSTVQALSFPPPANSHYF